MWFVAGKWRREDAGEGKSDNVIHTPYRAHLQLPLKPAEADDSNLVFGRPSL